MDKSRTTPLQNFMKYFGYLMAIVYIAAGSALVLAPWAIGGMDGGYTVLLGLLLIGYGFFRAYRLYQKYARRLHE